jgi:hypothetical protein
MSPTPSATRADDLVGEPLLEVDRDLRVRREELAQRLGQEFRERVGVRENSHLPGRAARIGAEVLAQARRLRQHGAGVLQQGAAGGRRRHALAAAHQERRSERLLHVADARRGGRERKVRPVGAVRDGACLDDVAEEAEIDEIEVHAAFRAFVGREG